MKLQITPETVPAIKSALNEALKVGGQQIEIKKAEDRRSIAQNACLHAKLTDIAKQVEWCGKRFDLVTWKRLTTAAFLREMDQQPNLIPALDGNGFDVVFERTSKMGLRMMSDYLEWVAAFGAENGVKWSCPAWMMDYDWKNDEK